MSSIKLRSKNDIRSFFRILAEESVKSAKESFYDPAAQDIEDQELLDSQAYKKIKEQGGTDEQPDQASAEDSNDSFVSDTDSEDVDDAGEADIDKSVKSIEQVNFSSLIAAIKQMRSGLSVDDTAVQNPLRSYFDFLSEPERKALYAFLDALSGIMTQKSTAEDAPDPSEPPYNVQMSSGGEDTTADSLETEPDIDDTNDKGFSDFSQDEEEEDDEEEESGEVPIAVGTPQKKQSIAEIRRKVQKLLGKS